MGLWARARKPHQVGRSRTPSTPPTRSPAAAQDEAHPALPTRALPLRVVLTGLLSAGLPAALLLSSFDALGLAALLVSPSTLRRRASIKLMTLVCRCAGCGFKGMPFCLERMSSISAFS